MDRNLYILSVLYFMVQCALAQNQEVAGPPTQAVHNATKYNRFLFNPAFSFNKEAADSGDKNGYISVYGRLEKLDFEGAPRSFNVTYSKTLNENMSLGGGLFQQNIGVISHFGGVLNYTYNVEFNRDVYVAFGANVSYQSAGLNSDLRTADSFQNNLVITDFDGTSIVRVSPGINVNYNNFDFGITARNIVSTSIGGNKNLYKSNTIVVHGMYSRPFARRSPNTARGMLYVEKETALDPVVGVNGFVENEKYGFAQLGYNQVYGISIGLGFNVTPQATVGYTVERGLGATDVFGLNHEFTLAYNFVEPQRRGRKRKPTIPKAKRKLPKRKEPSKAEKILALQEAREQSKDKLLALQNAKAKAGLLRTTKLKEAEEKDKASELVRTVSLQLEDNNLEKAKSTLERIKNSKYISDDDKRALISRYTKKAEIEEDIEEEETRVAEATKTKNNARALLARTNKLLNNKNSTDVRSTLELIRSSKYITDEEKQEIVSRLRQIEKGKEQEQIALVQEEERKKAAELLRSTSLLLDQDNLEEAKARAILISQSKFIPDVEKQQLLSRLNNKIKEKEQKEIALVQEEQKRRGAELLRETNLLLDEENTIAAQEKINEINNNQSIAEEDKQKIISRLQKVSKKQEVAIAEEEAKKLSNITRIDNGETVEQKEARLAKEAIVEAEAQLAAQEAIRIAEQEVVAEANRIAEEARIAEVERQEEEARKVLVSETEAIISGGSLEDAKARATLVRSSKLIPAEEKQRILSSLTRVIAEKEEEKEASIEATRIAEAARLAEEARIAEAQRIAEENRLAEEQRVAEAVRLAEESRLAEIERQKEEARKVLVSETEAIISGGSLEDAKARATLVRSSKLIPAEEKQRILSSLTRVIAEKEEEKEASIEATRIAEAARLAEEARIAEAQRVAEEKRLAAAEALRVEEVRKAEEQRVAEEARKVEAARIAEEKRLAAAEALRVEEARKAEEQRVAEEARKVEAARIAEEKRLAAAEALRVEEARKLEVARIAKERRLAEEKAQRIEQARIAEEKKIAEEEATRKAEAARIEEEKRLEEEARIEQERLIKEAKEANKIKATITRTTTTVKEEAEKRKKAELVRVRKLISDEDQKAERRKAVQAALKRTTKKVEENKEGSTLKRTLLPQQGSEKTKTNSNGMGFKADIIERQNIFFANELLMQPEIKVKSTDIIYFIDALVKSSDATQKVTNERIINLDKKKGLLKTKLKVVKTSEK